MKNNIKILVVVAFVVLISVVLLFLRSSSKNYINVDEFAFNPDNYLGKTITLRGVYFDSHGGVIVNHNNNIGFIMLNFGDLSNTSYRENNTELVNKYLSLQRNHTYDFTGIMGHEQKIYDENGNYIFSDYVFTVSDVKPVSRE